MHHECALEYIKDQEFVCREMLALFASQLLDENFVHMKWLRGELKVSKDTLEKMARERIAALTAERDALKEQISRFPNLSAMRQAMVDTSDENKILRELCGEMLAKLEYWVPVDQPFLGLVDSVSAVHRYKWYESTSLITKAKQVLNG